MSSSTVVDSWAEDGTYSNGVLFLKNFTCDDELVFFEYGIFSFHGSRFVAFNHRFLPKVTSHQEVMR
jgi:hypothetical protein